MVQTSRSYSEIEEQLWYAGEEGKLGRATGYETTRNKLRMNVEKRSRWEHRIFHFFSVDASRWDGGVALEEQGPGRHGDSLKWMVIKVS